MPNLFPKIFLAESVRDKQAARASDKDKHAGGLVQASGFSLL